METAEVAKHEEETQEGTAVACTVACRATSLIQEEEISGPEAPALFQEGRSNLYLGDET